MPFTQQPVQVGSQAAGVGLKEGLQVIGAGLGGGRLLLQEAPLSLQYPVLLLQEPHLWSTREETTWPAQPPAHEQTHCPNPGLMFPSPLPTTGPHLVDEGSKLVIEHLDLLLLLVFTLLI